MSKTYNSKHDFNKAYSIVEYPQGYVQKSPLGDIVHTIDDYDYSHTTDSDNENANIKCTRHPNKKRKKGSLTKEFHTVGVSDPSKWKWRYGEENDKSSRSHLIRNIMKHKRRHKLKEQTRKIIEESI